MIKLGETLFSKVLKINETHFFHVAQKLWGQFPKRQKIFEQGTFWNKFLIIFSG